MANLLNNENKNSKFHDNLLLRQHDNSTSVSPHGTFSSTSSSISNTSSNSSSIKSDSFNENIKILLPNGVESIKKIDTRKAIYDILIELAAASKLQPSNYTLQLFNEEMKLLEYTPNQTLAQLGPNIIKLIPKASTIKNSTLSLLNNNNNHTNLNTSNILVNKFVLNNNNSIINTNDKKPTFEITIRVQVNLPHNQITAVRVKPDIKLNDLLKVICDENLLDINKYKLIINSGNFDVNDVNYMNKPLSYFNINEVTLIYVHNRSVKRYDNNNVKNSKSSYSAYEQHEGLNRSKSEIDLHDENNNYKNNNEDDSKGSRKSSILNLFRKKRSRSKTSVTDDITRVKTLVNEQQQQQLQLQQRRSYQQQEDNKSYKSNENILFNSKKKQAPPPPPLSNTNSGSRQNLINNQHSEAQQKQEEEHGTKMEKVPSTISLLIANQSHKKKQAPLPPPLQKKQEIKAEEIKEEVIVEAKEELKKIQSNTNLSININKNQNLQISSSTTTIRTIETTLTTNNTNLNSPSSNKNTESDVEKDLNTNSLTSSMTSSKNCYDIHDTNDDKQNSLCISDNDDFQLNSTFNKEKSNENNIKTQTIPQITKFYDEYSLSNNSKTSSIEDLNKAFAITIAVAEQYVAKDEALKAKLISNSNNEIEKSPSIDESLKLSTATNRVKSYNGAIIDKNTTFNSIDDFSDVDVKIGVLTNDQIENINITCNHENKSINSEKSLSNDINEIENINEIDSNRRVFENNIQLVNENNREIEVIYESFNTESEKSNITKETVSNEIKKPLVKETIPDLKSFEENDRQSSVVYRHNLPSPSTTNSVDNSFNRRQLSMSYTDNLSQNRSNSISTENTSLQRQISISPTIDDHPSYKVVRSSDVYEKDGAFYSVDGTIRGYLGTVKKITTSKILSEIFTNNINNKDNNNDEHDDSQHKQQTKQQITPLSPLVPLSPRSIDEKINRNSLNIIHSSSASSDAKQNSKMTKSSLINIIASEKKSHPINNVNNNGNNIKANLTSLSTTSLQSKIVPTFTTIAKNSKETKNEKNERKSTITKIIRDEGTPKANINLSHLQNQNNQNQPAQQQQQSHELHPPHYHQQKLSTSFVMSAKNKTNNNLNRRSTPENHTNTFDLKDHLLNEIKSIVPVIEEHTSNIKDQGQMSPPFPPPPPPLPMEPPPPVPQTTTTAQVPPPIAPKNFTMKTIHSKPQIVSTYASRANLMDSIKSFNATTLRKTNLN